MHKSCKQEALTKIDSKLNCYGSDTEEYGIILKAYNAVCEIQCEDE